MAKIKIAFIYRPDNPYLNGKRSNNNYEKFYLHALKRTEVADVDFYGSNDFFDCKTIAGKYDVYLFFDVHEWGFPPNAINMDSLKGLKVCSIGDAHGAHKRSKFYNGTKIDLVKQWNIDYCYYQHTESYFYKFWPKEIKYWWIPIGIDPKLYNSVKPWKDRNGDKILLSGTVCQPYYPIRCMCVHDKNVFYHKPGSYRGRDSYTPGSYDKDDFKTLLEQWKFSIASACSVVLKYFEIPAAGCLSLAYVDEDNGAGIIGFEDYKTALLINKQNVFDKINEVIKTKDDPKWEEIAMNGRRFVLDNYTHDHCINKLIQKIKEVV